MEQKTSEELRSRHSIRILGGLRHTLQLQFNEMSSAWQHHSPDDDDEDNNAPFLRLGRAMESTRVAVPHVLQSSGKANAYRAPWRPEESFNLDTCPNPYTSLAQFHRKVMPFAHRDSPRARQPPRPGGAARRAGHLSPSNGRPDQVTSMVTPGRDGKATAQSSISNTAKLDARHEVRNRGGERSKRPRSHAHLYSTIEETIFPRRQIRVI